MRHVRVGDLSLRVIGSGSSGPDRPPFVLVHGIGMSHRYLARLHDELVRRGEQVFSVDLPGFGGLPRPARDLGVADMARALAAALDRCGVPPAVLVGQSMGTQWVTEAARLRPTAGVVLIGPVADERHRTPPRQALALAVDTLRESPGANALVLTDYLRCGLPWYTTQLRHMLTYPLEDGIRALRMPVLVLRGGRDPIAGLAWCRRLVRAGGDAELVLVPGHAHNCQHSAPRAVASALLAFAGRLAEAGRAA